MQQATKPRHLSSAQLRTLRDAVKAIRDLKTIDIRFVVGDSDSKELANQMGVGAFQGHYALGPQELESSTITGIQLWGEQTQKELISDLRAALVSVGLRVRIITEKPRGCINYPQSPCLIIGPREF